MIPTDPIRILAIADSESYLKWAARLVAGLSGFDTSLALIRTPILPTAEQISSALAGSGAEAPPIVDRRDLRGLLESHRPDVVIAAATGPVVQQVYGTAARLPQRPGLASGLPGVGLPVTKKGLRYRRLGDALIAHSVHEARAYTAQSAALRIPAEVVVTRLPMLASPEPPVQASTAEETTRLVFAPQAKVPPEREDREAILRALAAWTRAGAGRTCLIKLRSREGEQETHRDEHPFRDILADLMRSGAVTDELALAYGPMSDYLIPGSALVTVSSTAALESLDRGLPTAIISDFGVGEEMLNIAFAGSGLERTLDEIAAGDLPYPSQAWLADNYFQPVSSELAAALRLLGVRSRESQLPDLSRAARTQDWARLRAELRTLAPGPVVAGYRAARYSSVGRRLLGA